jgi:hypothetical protein
MECSEQDEEIHLVGAVSPLWKFKFGWIKDLETLEACIESLLIDILETW